MRVAPAGWYRYDLVWHKTTPTGFLNAKKAPLRNHELILIFSPMPLGKHTYNPQKTYGHVRKVSKASSKAGCKETELYGKAGLTTYDSTERYPLSVMTFKTDRQKSAIHPNQKPMELLRYLIRTYTNPGDAVMDPVAGIGIDFDGTCVTDLYPYVGDNIGAASVLRELGDKNLLILYTVRDGKYLQDAVDWFRYNHINLYSVNYNPEPVSSSPKLYCDYYIDGRNIGTPLTDSGH